MRTHDSNDNHTEQPEQFDEVTGGYSEREHDRAARRIMADLRAMDATPRAMPIGVDQLGSASWNAAIDAMETYGGSFVQNLARAWRRADGENHAKLVSVFRHYLDQYAAMAAREMGYPND